MERFDYVPAFHFQVSFLDPSKTAGFQEAEVDSRFQSVSGLTATVEADSVAEGGENRFKHQLPTRTTYSDIVLKRGLASLKSPLADWCRRTFETMEIRPVDLNISLLNDKHEPLMTWTVVHAWPKKWSLADLNAESSALTIETLELGCHYFRLSHS